MSSFFQLLQSGLWEHGVNLAIHDSIDFEVLYSLAEEQSVVGLIAAGLENVTDMRVRKKDALPFLKEVFSLENRNQLMNAFINKLVLIMRSAGFYPLLVKGQGIAQCYCRPHWRSSGDIDLLLDPDYYESAKSFLARLADSIEPEDKAYKHFGMTIGPWKIELHGTLHSGLSRRINQMLDQVQKESCAQGAVRVWRNDDVDIFLPNARNDVIFVFSHILQHFFHGGVGLRQICDWSRLLWVYRSEIDQPLLEQRLSRMKLQTEWKVFGCLAVKYLGYPAEDMPFYDESYERKADKVMSMVLEKGNMGRNVDNSYRSAPSTIKRKLVTIGHQLKDYVRIFFLFPLDSPRFLLRFFYEGFRRTRTITKLVGIY